MNANSGAPRPQIIVLGGSNGAGKTTIARRIVATHGLIYLGADEIAFELSPEDPYAVRLESGRLFLERYYEYVERRESFIVESTLSGRTFRKEIAAAKEAGYRVETIFCFLDSGDEAVARVAARIRKGGHFVPPSDIRRRYARSAKNFWELYRPLADSYLLIYNGGVEPIEVASSDGGNFEVHDQRLFDRFCATLAEET